MTEWKRISHGGPRQCKTNIFNIFTDKPGPTSFSKSRIIDGEALSAFNLMININMVQHIKHCTETEARRVLGREDWVLSIEELYSAFAIMYARGVIAKGQPLKQLWSQK